MPLILPGNVGSATAATGFNVANSLRFNSASTDYLNRTPSSASNRDTWTWSGWVKRSKLGSNEDLFSAYGDANNYTDIRFFGTNDNIQFRNLSGGNFLGRKYTNAQYRDVSAWMHIVAVWDTTNGTAADRQRLYVNGERLTSFLTTGNPGSGQDSEINDTSTTQVGAKNGADLFNGYMAEVVFVDGTALDPDSFGEFDEDSGIWKPIDVSGLTFGTNGFYLEFKESGTSANASGMGADTSGNTHHFTVNNLTAVDQSIDTCTNNFATLNNALNVGPQDLTDGNLTATGNTADDNGSHGATIGIPTSGKWYWEIKVTANESGGSEYPSDGLVVGGYGSRNQGTGAAGTGSSMYPDLYFDCQGKVERTNAGAGADLSGVGNAGSSGIKQFAIDMDNGAFYIGLNGTYLNNGTAVGVPTSGSTKTGVIWDFTPANYPDIAIAVSNYNDSSNSCNFGSPPYAISSGNTDGNGYGNFEYAVPSGYYALNTKNLAEYG